VIVCFNVGPDSHRDKLGAIGPPNNHRPLTTLAPRPIPFYKRIK
jgi:hypothetical protein